MLDVDSEEFMHVHGGVKTYAQALMASADLESQKTQAVGNNGLGDRDNLGHESGPKELAILDVCSEGIEKENLCMGISDWEATGEVRDGESRRVRDAAGKENLSPRGRNIKRSKTKRKSRARSMAEIQRIGEELTQPEEKHIDKRKKRNRRKKGNQEGMEEENERVINQSLSDGDFSESKCNLKS